MEQVGNKQGQVLRLDKRLYAKRILWLKDESLEASDNLPDPDADVIALEIVEDLEATLEQFREIVSDLGVQRLKKGPADYDSAGRSLYRYSRLKQLWP